MADENVNGVLQACEFFRDGFCNISCICDMLNSRTDTNVFFLYNPMPILSTFLRLNLLCKFVSERERKREVRKKGNSLTLHTIK